MFTKGELKRYDRQIMIEDIGRKGQERLGLAVDALSTTQEIVIKPLNKLLRGNKYFSGSTIIGSGEVVLILDVSNLLLTKRKNGIPKQTVPI